MQLVQENCNICFKELVVLKPLISHIDRLVTLKCQITDRNQLIIIYLPKMVRGCLDSSGMHEMGDGQKGEKGLYRPIPISLACSAMRGRIKVPTVQ